MFSHEIACAKSCFLMKSHMQNQNMFSHDADHYSLVTHCINTVWKACTTCIIMFKYVHICLFINEPRCEKTGLRGFRPGLTQTGLYSHTRQLYKKLRFLANTILKTEQIQSLITNENITKTSLCNEHPLTPTFIL